MKLTISDNYGNALFSMNMGARGKLWRDVVSALLAHYVRECGRRAGSDAFWSVFVWCLHAAYDERSRMHPQSRVLSLERRGKLQVRGNPHAL